MAYAASALQFVNQQFVYQQPHQKGTNVSEPVNERGRGVIDRLAGKTKEVAGAVLRNDDLKQEGQLQQTKADVERQAARDAEVAAQREAEADVRTTERELEVERRRLAAETAAEAERDMLDREHQTKEAAVEQAAAQREELVERQAEAEHTATARAEAAAQRERLAAESEAAAKEREAAQAREAAAALDEAIDTTN